MRADLERGVPGRDRWSEALTWYVALHEPDRRDLSCMLWREWQEWYADPLNRRIFRDLSRLLADRHRYREPDRSRKAELEEDPYDASVPVTVWRGSRTEGQVNRWNSSTRRWWSIRWLFGGFGIAGIAVLLVVPALRFDHARSRVPAGRRIATVDAVNAAGVGSAEFSENGEGAERINPNRMRSLSDPSFQEPLDASH